MIITPHYLRFERASKAPPQADACEKIASFCLKPFRFGREIVLIKKDGKYVISEKRTSKIARAIALLLATFLFPLTAIGLLALRFSKTHRFHVQQLKSYLTEDPALQLLKSRNLFIKVIGNGTCKGEKSRRELLGDFEWDYLIQEMKDPHGTRLERRAKKAAQNQIKYVYDSNIRSMVPHRRENFYRGTNKTSLTLLPSNAKTALAHMESQVGLLFDARKCQVKGKYVFGNDGVTLGKWWRALFNSSQVNSHDFPKLLEEKLKSAQACIKAVNPALGSMAKLQQKLAEQEKRGFIRHYNEVLASVSKEAVVGLFCNIDPNMNDPDYELRCLSRKVAAISRRAYLKEELGLKKNIYVMDAEGLRLYPLEEQKRDLNKVISSPGLLEGYARLLSAKGTTSVAAKELRTQLQELIAT